MKPNRIVVVAAVIVVALLALLVAAPFLIPASQYRASLQQAASDALGREVKVSGGLRFSVFPTLGVNAQQVSIANRPGGKAPLFANIDELDVGVALLPLLHGDVEISKLVLKKPTLALEADAGGKPNWVFEPKQKPNQTPAQQAQAAQLDRLGLGDVHITEGALTYRDNLGKVQAVSALNATATLKSLDSPLSLTSDFIYAGDPVKLTIDAPTPRAFTQKTSTLLKILLESEKLTAALDGAIDPNDMSITGKLDAKGPSLRKLAAWVGSPIGEGGGMGEFAVIGDLTVRGQVTSLANATIAIDKAKGRGDLAITLADAAPPYVKATLALDALDVNPYLAAPQTPGAADAAKGVDVKQGWGNAKIDQSGLKAINADLALTTGPLLFQKIKIDRSAIDVAVKDGVMRATMKQLALYGGKGSGTLVLDGRGDGLRLQNDLAVDGLAAKPFLTDAMGLDKIEGAARITMSIAGAGATQQAIMNTLAGKANFAFTNGAIVGVNLGLIASQIQSVLTGAAIGPAAKTDFGQMGASFAIARGVAHTNDLRVVNPVISITGSGDINLAQQSMDMKIVPTTAKSGKGVAQGLGGISVPFHVTGPWAKLKFAPDLGGLVQGKVSQELNKVLGKNGLGDLGALFGKKGH
jgi:AsmA protein